MPLTMQLFLYKFFLALDVEFKLSPSGKQLFDTIASLEKFIKNQFPEIKRIYV